MERALLYAACVRPGVQNIQNTKSKVSENKEYPSREQKMDKIKKLNWKFVEKGLLARQSRVSQYTTALNLVHHPATDPGIQEEYKAHMRSK